MQKGRNRSCRRTGIRIFNIYQCSAGIRDQDRTGGDTAGRIYQRCGSGSYGRRKTGQTDGDGKAPIGVAKLAKKYGKTVIAFAGSVERDARECNEHGIDAFFPVLRSITTLEEAMKNENAKRNLADTAEQVYRLWR